MPTNPYQSPEEQVSTPSVSRWHLLERALAVLILVVVFVGAALIADIGTDPSRRHLLRLAFPALMGAAWELMVGYVALRCPRERAWRLIPLAALPPVVLAEVILTRWLL
jgi:hypothetical protein